MGGEVSSNSIYRACCGESEDPETQTDIQNEAKSNGETPIDNFDFQDEEQHKGLISKDSNDALDSFLKHQFSDLTPEIIKAQGLDPFDDLWKAETHGFLFKVSISLGPLTNLSQLVYDDIDTDELIVRYNETLHLNTDMNLKIKIRDGETLTLGLQASLSLDPKGTDIDNLLTVPIRGKVRVEGLKIECIIQFHHSLDIEWNDREKSIEGTFQNDLRLGSVNISYQKIVLQFGKPNIGDLTPSLWIQIEEKITEAVTDVFKKQIEKLLNKIIRNQMEKVLNQINHKVPKFEIDFDKKEERTTEEEESDDDQEMQRKNKFNLFRKFKF